MNTVHACRQCGAAFRVAAYRDLHVGRRHTARDEVEREAFARAVREEDETLARVRRHVRAGFVALPLFLLYVFVSILLFELDGNPAWIVMVTPGFVMFGALMYAMAYSREATPGSEEAPPRPGARDVPPRGRP